MFGRCRHGLPVFSHPLSWEHALSPFPLAAASSLEDARETCSLAAQSALLREFSQGGNGLTYLVAMK